MARNELFNYNIRSAVRIIKHLLFALLLATLSNASLAQDSFPLKELKFYKFFGQRAGDSTIYCLLGNGFIRTISSNEEDSVITGWISKHQEAKAIPVSIMGESSRISFAYIWAVDDTESLNLLLVKRGVFPGSVMLDAVHADSLTRGTRARAMIEAGAAHARKMNPKLPRDEDGPPRRLVPDSTYEAFLEELQDAEAIAQRNKAGIWSDKFKELREE